MKEFKIVTIIAFILAILVFRGLIFYSTIYYEAIETAKTDFAISIKELQDKVITYKEKAKVNEEDAEKYQRLLKEMPYLKER